MKKTISLLTSILMLGSLIMGNFISVNAVDEDTTSNTENVAEINGTSYATLGDAVDAVTDGQTIKILKDGDISGVVVKEGKNFTIDFNNKTVNITEPMVGSSGTETNGFQLLKNSTLTFKNGTIKTSDSSNKILIQNYCNLTLENIVIDASQSSNTEYVLSNNFGNTLLKGTTSIYAAPNRVAFDLWYGLSSVYDGGVSLTFDSSFTGTVKGIVEYGATTRANKDHGTAWAEKTVMNIENGNFDIKLMDSNANDGVALADANINIKGGHFTFDPTDYVKPGYKAYNVDGAYQVQAVAKGITLSETAISLEVDKTQTLTATLDPKDSLETVVWESDDKTIATVKDGVITAVAPGKTTITATADKVSTTCEVSVYKVEQPTPPNVDTTTPVEKPTAGLDDEKAPDILNEALNDIISNTDTTFADQETVENINNAVENGQVITIVPQVETLDTSNTMVTEDIKKIETELKTTTDQNNSTTEVAIYLDLNVLVQAKNETLGKINALPEPIKFSVVLPEDVAKAAQGKDVYILRVHDGKVEKIKAELNGNVITFETDKFSTYAVVLEDKTVTPPTPEVTTHNVTFTDMNGAVLKIVTVKDGEAAIAPEAPVVEGYKFVKWDGEYSKVTKDLVIKAVYEKLPVEETPAPEEKKDTDNPPTGDTTNTALYSAFAMLGLVSAALIMVERKRRSLSR